MNNQTVTIIDYGMGNLWSVESALRYLGCNVKASGDPDQIARADSLLLPGVGSFAKAMTALKQRGIDGAIREAVEVKGRKILGICLGMQLMGLDSSEDGDTLGLGFINCSVDKFTIPEVGDNKLPHIGFDTVYSNTDGQLFKNLQRSADFYFVHSYRMLPKGLNASLATCSYGVDFLAAYELDNIFATQFHPEKSQANGLVLLKNFLTLRL
jgi:imidazole glycerol-phosphate synthase subunit HisH